MIQIRDKKKYILLSANVTDFADSVGYCEHKIPFYLEGKKVAPKLETIQGTIAHEEEEEVEKEQFEFVPITVKELNDINMDVEFAREDIHTRLLLPMKVGDKNIITILFGRADKVFRKDQTLVIQEDKFPYNVDKYRNVFDPYDSQKLQALAYLNSKFTEDPSSMPDEWFNIPHKEKSWVIQIRDRNKDNEPFKIFKGKQTKEALNYLTGYLKRFAALSLGIEERVHHNNPGKCRPCSFFNECQFSLN